MNDNQNNYKGSLDPFEDMADKLEELGVPYCLMVSVNGKPEPYSWSNLYDFKNKDIDDFDKVWGHTKDICLEELTNSEE